MKTALLLFFHLAVCAAQENRLEVLPVFAGEDLRITFSLSIPPGKNHLFFCRLPCNPGDMLLWDDGLRIKSGRYTVQLDRPMQVVIKQVTKQDEGLYRVGVSSSDGKSHIEFRLQVADLCDGVVNWDREHEYWGALGTDLTVRCDLNDAPSDRRFLCREDCSTFLIDTNSQGYNHKYSLEYVDRGIRATIYNLSPSDAGRYHCGESHGRSYTCQEFTVRVNGAVQINTVTDKGSKDHKTALPTQATLISEGRHTDWTLVAVTVVMFFLVVIILTLVIVLMNMKRKLQPAHYVNTSSNATTRPGWHHSQPASFDSGAPDYYTNLRSETRESEYSEIQLQPVQHLKQTPQ